MNLRDMRRDYARSALDEASTAADPFMQFRHWFAEAEAAELREPNAMTLATVDPSGRPSARIVLLKHIDTGGLTFFTDYRSRKGRELAANPYAALVFHWPELERQVRIVGTVERVSAADSWEYFRSRPFGSRVGAWVSHQSAPLADHEALEASAAALAAAHPDGEVPLPPHWGGFRVLPTEFEFWQGRPNRLHDRIVYHAEPEGAWRRSRISP
ncbi:MAG: pyridoxamine 5'-phosphate oxidase [Gemmatimonadota bacterium]